MRIAAFMRDESCGQCVPCRVGTVRQEELLARLVSGRTRGSVEDELALLDEIDRCMTDASICGLGQTAASAIRSAVARLGAFRNGGRVTRTVTLEIDGREVEVEEGQTILDACRKLEIDTPTLCYADTLRPVNACRVCVVELEGARTLVPRARAAPRTG